MKLPPIARPSAALSLEYLLARLDLAIDGELEA